MVAVLRYTAILLLSACLGSWVVLVHRLAGEPVGGFVDAAESGPRAARAGGEASEATMRPFAFDSNEDCEPCHREIFDEWFEDEHSRSWFNRPLLPQDPKRTECSPCHAPRPILEVGIETFPVVRAERHHEGVGCIECHARVDHVEGPRAGADAACNPRRNHAFTRSEICASCHAPHGSLDEWRSSAWSRRGYTCQSCHMPLIDAPAVTGGPPRRRRSHRMRTQRDPELLRSAVTAEASIHGGAVVVRLTNSGAGHSVPGEIFNRELFLKTTVRDSAGAVLGEHRESFKAVRREKRATDPSTQLRAGEERVFRYRLPAGARGTVTAFLGYKLLFYEPDRAALRVWRQELEY